MEQPLKSILNNDLVGASSVSSTSEEDATDDDPVTSFHRVEKGYRLFKSGHVQRIEFHPLPASSEFCFVRAKVLPSMVKNVYCVRIYLTSDGHIHTAYCVFPAGLAGCCNHVAALIYALEEFVRLGL